MKSLKELNINLNKMSTNKQLVDSTRATIVNEIITLIIEESKGHEFANKRVAQKWIIEELLSDDNKNLDTYTKRAIKLAKAILVEGYKVKKELLTLAQAENVCKEEKATVNGLMELDGDEYIEDVKECISLYTRNKAVNELHNLDALVNLEELKQKFGDDTRKVLNNMLKAL